MHRHHILPKRLGGDDSAENITPPISIKLHAEFHRDLWEHYGDKKDYIAWMALSGRMNSEQARIAACKEGQRKSLKYRTSRSALGIAVAKASTYETCSRGGKIASKKLVEWIRKNRARHAQRCRELGRANASRLCIPHGYNGVVYPSKKALQAALGISICGFYGKLKRGEIVRLPKAS